MARRVRGHDLPNLDRLADSIGKQLKALPSKTPYVSSTKSKSSSKPFKIVPREPEERVRSTEQEREAVEVEPAYDTNGDPLTVEDIYEALKEIALAELNIDRDAKRTAKDPEQQANRVKNLSQRYKARTKELEELLKQARKRESWERHQLGFRSYNLSSDEANLAVTELMDETINWYFAEVDNLKDRVSDTIRAKLDDIDDPGIDRVPFRERLYGELVQASVIESWEPLEF